MAKRVRPRPVRVQRSPRRAPVSRQAKSVVGVSRSPVPAPPPPRPLAAAIVVFQQAMSALQAHQYREAAAKFEGLIDQYPAERALLDRSRVYLDLCHRELERQPSTPRTIEERLIEATAALNNGDDRRAETLAKGVVADSPDQDLALYLLAAVEARRGAQDAAVALLKRAVEVSPEVRAQARHDADFEPLRCLEAFKQLLDRPVTDAPASVLAPRRARRARDTR